MGKDLFHTYPPFHHSLLNLNDICQKQFQVSFLEFITTGEQDLSYFPPVQTHLAIIALELALAELWKSWGLTPQGVVGHSLGEYAALCVAGVLSTNHCLSLVYKLARLLQEKCKSGTYGMLATKCDPKTASRILERNEFGTCTIACINGPRSTVISG